VSTIKSSAEDLTLNADGSGNDIKFQINAVEKASISSAGLLTSTTIDATALTGNLPAIDGSSLTGITTGKVLQVVSNTWTIATSVASTSYASVGYSPTSITPSATTSKILILVNFQAFIRYDAEGHQYASFKITKDTNTTVKEFGCAIREHHLVFGTANTAKLWGGSFAIVFLDSPSSTSSLEYALAMKCLQTSPNGIVIVNEHNYLGENPASTITLMEIGA